MRSNNPTNDWRREYRLGGGTKPVRDLRFPNRWLYYHVEEGATPCRLGCAITLAIRSAPNHSASMTGMSMLRFLEEKLMPIRVTGRLPPFHLSA